MANRKPFEAWVNAFKSKTNRVRNWFLFTICASLLPFTVAIFLGFDHLSLLSPKDLVGHGDLYLASAILTAGGLGELSGKHGNPAMIDITNFLVWAVAVISVALYGHVLSTLAVPGTFHPYINTELSIPMYIAAIVTTIACVVVPEGAENGH